MLRSSSRTPPRRRCRRTRPPPGGRPRLGRAGSSSPSPCPMSRCRTSRDASAPLSALRGRPAVLLFWSAQASGSQAALLGLARGAAALAQAGVGSLAIALDGPADQAKVRAAARAASALPVAVASEEAALGFAILNRHLFLTRQPIAAADGLSARRRGPGGEGVPRGRGRPVDPPGRGGDRGLSRRAARACPALRRDVRVATPPRATTSPTAASCSTRDSKRRRSSPSSRRRREARARRSSTAWGACSVKTGQTDQGEGRLRAGPGAAARPVRGQQRPRHAPGGERGHPGGDRAVPGGPRRHARLPRRPQQPGLRPPPDRPRAEARELYERALEAPARLPRGPEQPRPHPGAARRAGPRRALLPEGSAERARATARPRTTWPSSSSAAASPRRRSASCRGSSRRTRPPRAPTSRWRRSTWPRIVEAKDWRSSSASCSGTRLIPWPSRSRGSSDRRPESPAHSAKTAPLHSPAHRIQNRWNSGRNGRFISIRRFLQLVYFEMVVRTSAGSGPACLLQISVNGPATLPGRRPLSSLEWDRGDATAGRGQQLHVRRERDKIDRAAHALPPVESRPWVPGSSGAARLELGGARGDGAPRVGSQLRGPARSSLPAGERSGGARRALRRRRTSRPTRSTRSRRSAGPWPRSTTTVTAGWTSSS